MIFNVIYTRGTVAALSRFIPMFLASSTCSYRLVANGTTAEEDAHLQSFTDGRRCLFARLDTTEVLPLGKAYVALAETFRDDVFAYMDSDIAVTGDIGAEFGALLDSHEAVFSGAAIWCRPEDQVVTAATGAVAGPHHWTDDGICLGSSYFGVFRRATFDEVARRCRVRPDKYTAADLETVDPGFRRFLADRGLVKADYVPPKVLSIAYAYLGLPTTYHESPNLHHIGGYSMATYAQAAGVASGDQARGLAGTAGEILSYQDERPHMRRKQAVCERVMRSFALIDAGQDPAREPAFDADIEARVRLVEDLYRAQATTAEPR